MKRRSFLGALLASPVAAKQGSAAWRQGGPAPVYGTPVNHVGGLSYGDFDASPVPFKAMSRQAARAALQADPSLLAIMRKHIRKDIDPNHLVIPPDIQAMRSFSAVTKQRLALERVIQHRVDHHLGWRGHLWPKPLRAIMDGLTIGDDDD